MSDVERICEQNYQRVRWAEEYADNEKKVVSMPNRKQRIREQKRRSALWSATLACAGFCGAGATFLAIGIGSMNMKAIVTGAIVVLVFMLFGFVCDSALGDE